MSATAPLPAGDDTAAPDGAARGAEGGDLLLGSPVLHRKQRERGAPALALGPATRNATGEDAPGPSDEDLPVAFRGPRCPTFAESRGASPGTPGADSVGSSTSPGAVPAIIMSGQVSPRWKRIKRVSNYILGPIMGEGSYGVVRDAIDTSIPGHSSSFRRVAIKSVSFRPPPHASAYALQRLQALRLVFENEVQLLQRFHNPHVIRAADIFSRDGKDYIVLPIALCSLEQLVKDHIMVEADTDAGVAAAGAGGGGDGDDGGGGGAAGDGDSTAPAATATTRSSLPPPPPSPPPPPLSSQLSTVLIKGIFYQIVSGVYYLHQQGIAHNDLKPSNILLFADGVVKLTDLGCCGTEFGGHGTPAYFSPEICRRFFHIESDPAAPAADAPDPSSDPTHHHHHHHHHHQQDCSSHAQQSMTQTEGPQSAAAAAQVEALMHEPVKGLGEVDARRSDMWCCGVILYYLLTERLPFRTAGRENRYQLMREIVESDIVLDHIPELVSDDLAHSCVYQSPSAGGSPSERPSASLVHDESSVKHLLRHLLDKNPDTRYTAHQVLHHPWLVIESAPDAKKSPPPPPAAAAAAPAPAPPPPRAAAAAAVSAQASSHAPDTDVVGENLDDHIQHDVARRVLRSKEMQRLIKRDLERHLQFVAETCHVFLIALPQIIFDNGAGSRSSRGASTRDGATAPVALYRGTVDRSLFLDERGQRHYERTKRAPENDVRSMRGNPMKRLQMMAYLESVLVNCGVPRRRSGLAPDHGPAGGGASAHEPVDGPPSHALAANSLHGGQNTARGGDIKEGSKCFCGLM